MTYSHIGIDTLKHLLGVVAIVSLIRTVTHEYDGGGNDGSDGGQHGDGDDHI